MSFAPDDEQGGGTNVVFIGLAFSDGRRHNRVANVVG